MTIEIAENAVVAAGGVALLLKIRDAACSIIRFIDHEITPEEFLTWAEARWNTRFNDEERELLLNDTQYVAALRGEALNMIRTQMLNEIRRIDELLYS